MKNIFIKSLLALLSLSLISCEAAKPDESQKGSDLSGDYSLTITEFDSPEPTANHPNYSIGTSYELRIIGEDDIEASEGYWLSYDPYCALIYDQGLTMQKWTYVSPCKGNPIDDMAFQIYFSNPGETEIVLYRQDYEEVASIKVSIRDGLVDPIAFDMVSVTRYDGGGEGQCEVIEDYESYDPNWMLSFVKGQEFFRDNVLVLFFTYDIERMGYPFIIGETTYFQSYAPIEEFPTYTEAIAAFGLRKTDLGEIAFHRSFLGPHTQTIDPGYGAPSR